MELETSLHCVVTFCAFIIIVVLIIFLSVVAGPYLAYFIEAIVEAFESMI